MTIGPFERHALFLFTDEQPSDVQIYPNLQWAKESLESQDVAAFQKEAFTETGHVVRLSESEELFAKFDPTDRIEVDHLKKHLREVEGPQHLADSPTAYAAEWLRLDDLDARRPPVVPVRLWNWHLRRFRIEHTAGIGGTEQSPTTEGEDEIVPHDDYS